MAAVSIFRVALLMVSSAFAVSATNATVCKDTVPVCSEMKDVCADPEAAKNLCPKTCGLCEDSKECSDKESFCKYMISKDYCETSFNRNNCRKTCGHCEEECVDLEPECPNFKSYCGKLPYVTKNCPMTCGGCTGGDLDCKEMDSVCSEFHVKQCLSKYYLLLICPKLCGTCGTDNELVQWMMNKPILE